MSTAIAPAACSFGSPLAERQPRDAYDPAAAHRQPRLFEDGRERLDSRTVNSPSAVAFVGRGDAPPRPPPLPRALHARRARRRSPGRAAHRPARRAASAPPSGRGADPCRSCARARGARPIGSRAPRGEEGQRSTDQSRRSHPGGPRHGRCRAPTLGSGRSRRRAPAAPAPPPRVRSGPLPRASPASRCPSTRRPARAPAPRSQAPDAAPRPRGPRETWPRAHASP